MEDLAMKKLMITFALMSMAFGLAASHPNPSELNISLHDGALFNISISNHSFNQLQSSYTIAGLRPGRHYLEIVRFERYFNGRFFVLGGPRVVFADYINIPARKLIVAHIDHRHRFVVTDLQNLVLHLASVHTPERRARIHTSSRPVQRAVSVPVAMGSAAFASLMATLENTRFESNRVEIARKVIASSHLGSVQVRDLKSLFSFESNRLDLAKFAYRYAIDPENYFLVHNALHFSNSSRELNRFITSKFY